MTAYEPPERVIAAIEALLERRPRAALQASAQRLSEIYRARRSTRDAIRDETDALAYALTRMPATFAATMAALTRLAESQPDFAPRGMLDVGCGLAAAAYATCEIWPETGRVTLVDRSRPFLTLARDIAADSGVAAMARADIIEADFARLPASTLAEDLVVASYAFTELAETALPELVEALWAQTAGALVIVEPGTPRDHQRLMILRAKLIAKGATILAPCPHALPCAIVQPDWCHFAVRLPRRRAHKMLKGAQAPFEDEKFAYLVATRFGAPAAARIVAPPRETKAGIALKLCTDKGIYETFIPKRDKPRYEENRKKAWGDATDAPAATNAPETSE